MATVAELVEKFEKKMEERVDELAEAVDAQGEEIREKGGSSAESTKKVEGLEAELKSISDAFEELKGMGEEVNEIKSRLDRPGGGDPQRKGRQSPGVAFSESDEFKSFIDQREQKSSPHELGSLSNLLAERKSPLTSEEGVWGGGGILIEPQTIPGILTEPQRQIRFRDLVNVQQVNSDAVRYVMETGFANLYARLAANVIAGATTVELDTEDGTGVAGFFAGQTVIVGGETHVIAEGGVDAAADTITLTTALAGAHNAGTEVISDQIGGTPHGGRKPMSSIRFDDMVGNIITIAHWIAAHRQTLEDAPQLQNMVNTRLLFGLEMALEDQALYGTASSTTLLGIFNTPGVQDVGTRTGTDPNGNNWTEIDWLRKAMTRAMIAEYPVNGFMVNPLNWEAIELAKDSQGRYLWMTVTEGGVRRLFGVPVAVSTSVRAGDFLTGAFGLGATLLDRQQANIRISDSHAHFFIENMLAILAEVRVGLILPRPESLIKGRF